MIALLVLALLSQSPREMHQRMNEILHSGDFENVAWEKSSPGALRPRAVLSPMGGWAEELDGSVCQLVVVQPGRYAWSIYAKGDAWLRVEELLGWWVTPWEVFRYASPPSSWVRLGVNFDVGVEQVVRACVVAGKAPVWGAQLERYYATAYIETGYAPTSTQGWCVSVDPRGCP